MFIGKRKTSILATLVFCISLLAGAAILVMLFGALLGLWEPIDGFIYYRSSFEYIGYVVVGLSVATLGFLLSKKHLIGKRKAGIALLIGLGILYPTIKSAISETISYPPIHDITTDTENPPEFIALTDPRPGSRNTLDYFGKGERQEWYPSRQLEAFPDIKPIITDISPDQAYTRAVTVGESMGWEIIGADPAARRFEGTATTPIFRFVDDTVVVVTPAGTGSRVDIRSVSRIGTGDIGVNAKRIREFILRFNG